MTGKVAAQSLPKASNITHQHLLAVLNTQLLGRQPESGPVTICDIGCGDGRFLAYLAQCLPVLRPDLQFEFLGLDVDDSVVQAEGFFQRTLENLGSVAPGINWAEKLLLISSTAAWPFADKSIDFAISSQILEHVRDHDAFCSKLSRVLKPEGVSFHLFPLKHYFWEGHLRMPLVHRFQSFELLRWWIALMSRLHIGIYKEHRRDYGVSIAQFSESHADYMVRMTNYLSKSELLRLCKRQGFRSGFKFTKNFYFARLRGLFGPAPRYLYSDAPSAFGDAFWLWLCKRISSITLFLETRNTYRR